MVGEPPVSRQVNRRAEVGGLDYLKPQLTLKQQLEEFLPESSRFMSLMEFVLARNEQRLDEPQSFSLWFTKLGKYLEYQEVQAGDTLILQGENLKGLYFVENGQLIEQFTAGGQHVRIRTLGAGSVVGEAGFYTGWPAAATVFAVQPSIVYKLSAEQLKQMETDDPEVAADLHKFIAQILCERLVSTTNALHAFVSPEEGLVTR